MSVSRTVSIANGASLSGAVEIDDGSVNGIITPAAWTTANLTLQGSYDKENFFNVYDVDGNEVTINADASRYIILNPSDFLGMKALKIRSGTSGSPVTQGAARSLTVVVFPV